jgi:hypothetical protein
VSFDWRLTVEEEDGTLRGVFTSSNPVASLDDFSVDPLGGSVTASFQGLPKVLGIEARDVVTLEVEPPSGSFTPVFKGYVSSLPSPFSDEVGTYNLVGMRQRLYEVPVADVYLRQRDLADMVKEAISGSNLPVGVTYSAAAVPTLNFEAGIRLPQGETLGDLLDDLAATVGRFIVPPSLTYTYDSVVFSAGEVVPAVRWGVDANGVVFFRRPLIAAVALDESDVNTRIDWQDISAEEIPNVIGLVYGSAYDLNLVKSAFTFQLTGLPVGFFNDELTVQPVPYAMIRRLGSGSALPAAQQRYRRVDVENPLDFCERYTGYTTQSTNWTNPNNVLDNDILTFAEASSASNSLVINTDALTTPSPPFKDCFLIVDYESTDDFDMTVRFNAAPFNVFPVLGALVLNLQVVLPDSGGQRGRALLFLGVPATAPFTSATSPSFEFSDLPEFTKIYRMSVFAPDVDLGGDLSERLARAYERQVQLTAGRVQVYDYLTPSAVAEVTAIGDPPVEVPVERVEYRLTTSEGLSTTFQLGAAYDAELEVERVLLERLARRAVREGGARR